ncbi:hypothetical protein Peur_021363 [Populus x canadensis]
MLARRFISLFKGSQASQIPSGVKSLDEGKSKSFGRKAVSFCVGYSHGWCCFECS